MINKLHTAPYTTASHSTNAKALCLEVCDAGGYTSKTALDVIFSNSQAHKKN